MMAIGCTAMLSHTVLAASYDNRQNKKIGNVQETRG